MSLYPFSAARLRLTLAFPRLPVKGCEVRLSRHVSSQLLMHRSQPPTRRSVRSEVSVLFFSSRAFQISDVMRGPAILLASQ
jgi:hypothetical protein